MGDIMAAQSEAVIPLISRVPGCNSHKFLCDSLLSLSYATIRYDPGWWQCYFICYRFLVTPNRYTLTKGAPATDPSNKSGQTYSRGQQIFQTYRRHLEIPGARRVNAASSKLRAQKILGPSVENLVATTTWSPAFVQPWSIPIMITKSKKVW